MTGKERISVVKEIFSTVTDSYDFLNHLMSLRRDIAWRRFAVKKMRFFKTHRLLDVATGTGDLAIDAARSYSSVHVTGLDFVKPILDVGRQKTEKANLSGQVRFIKGDALALPFKNNAFDVAAIAFGIRNIPDRLGALAEMGRVVVPGGQVLVLEMTFPRQNPFRGVYRFYLQKVLPRLGRVFSNHPAAYEYLGDSILNFPDPDAFSGEMESVNLTHIKKYPLDFGITYLHTGMKTALPPPLF